MLLPNIETATANISTDEAWRQLKKKRDYYVFIRTLLWLVALLLFLIGIWLIDFSVADMDDTDGGDAFFLAIGVMIAAVLLFRKWSKSVHKKYSVHYKQVIVRKLISNIIQNVTYPKEINGVNRCTYKETTGISTSTLKKSPLFKDLSYNIYHGEDLFKGTLGLTDFEFSELLLEKETTDSDNNKSIHRVFQGFVFMADFHKHFEGTTIIESRKGKKYSLKTGIGSHMKTVSYEFDKMFKIRTTDEVTARYLLPVNMLERIVQLRKTFKKYGITICMHDGMITLVVHRCDFFEANGFKKLETKAIQKTYMEICTVLEIIDQLNLNTRIWGKN